MQGLGDVKAGIRGRKVAYGQSVAGKDSSGAGEGGDGAEGRGKTEGDGGGKVDSNAESNKTAGGLRVDWHIAQQVRSFLAVGNQKLCIFVAILTTLELSYNLFVLSNSVRLVHPARTPRLVNALRRGVPIVANQVHPARSPAQRKPARAPRLANAPRRGVLKITNHQSGVKLRARRRRLLGGMTTKTTEVQRLRRRRRLIGVRRRLLNRTTITTDVQ